MTSLKISSITLNGIKRGDSGMYLILLIEKEWSTFLNYME